MKHLLKITDSESEDLIDRTEGYFVKQIPPECLTKYNLSPEAEIVLHYLWFDTFMGKDTVLLSYYEYSAFRNIDRRIVSKAFGELRSKNIICMVKAPEDENAKTKDDSVSRRWIISIIVPLKFESDKSLTEERTKRKERLEKLRAVNPTPKQRKNKPSKKKLETEINSEPENNSPYITTDKGEKFEL